MLEIDLILSASSANMGYYIGFADAILKSNKVKIRNVYACSGGSWVAPYVITNRMSEAIEWYESLFYIENSNIKNYKVFNDHLQLFTLFERIPYIGVWVTLLARTLFFLLVGTFFKSYNLNFLDEFLKRLSENEKAMLKGVQVVTTNLTPYKSKWHKVSFNSLKKSIIASSTNGLNTPAVEINKFSQIDGIFTEMIPLSNLPKDDILKVVLTFDIVALDKFDATFNKFNLPIMGIIDYMSNLAMFGCLQNARKSLKIHLSERNDTVVYSCKMGWGLNDQQLFKSITNTNIAKGLLKTGAEHAKEFLETQGVC